MKPGDAYSLARYVVKRAPQYHLDANAVVAVAIQEGISGKVGDHGTSYGPWQLHKGGAYPANGPSDPDAANAWAWSPAGVDYALSRMQPVAGGLRGRAAVHAIVYRFERPSDPASEYAAAVQALPGNDGGPKGGGGLGSLLGEGAGVVVSTAPGLGTVVGAAGGIGSAASDVVGGTESLAHFVEKLLDPGFWLRALEVAGGAAFVLFGLYLLGRMAGVAPSATKVAGTAAMLTPEGKVAKAAGAVAAVGSGGSK